VLVVVVTGNHYWLDALAAALLVLFGLGVADSTAFLWRRRHGAKAEAPSSPVPWRGVSIDSVGGRKTPTPGSERRER
jgi:hypothetical protein